MNKEVNSSNFSSLCHLKPQIFIPWLPRPLAICDEQTIICINTFPDTLSSQMAKIHEISTYFFDKQYRNFVSRSATTVKL